MSRAKEVAEIAELARELEAISRDVAGQKLTAFTVFRAVPGIRKRLIDFCEARRWYPEKLGRIEFSIQPGIGVQWYLPSPPQPWRMSGWSVSPWTVAPVYRRILQRKPRR